MSSLHCGHRGYSSQRGGRRCDTSPLPPRPGGDQAQDAQVRSRTCPAWQLHSSVRTQVRCRAAIPSSSPARCEERGSVAPASRRSAGLGHVAMLVPRALPHVIGWATWTPGTVRPATMSEFRHLNVDQYDEEAFSAEELAPRDPRSDEELSQLAHPRQPQLRAR